jgi:hypothetical protein
MLYCYEKRFSNPFMILFIYKFCYFNLAISSYITTIGIQCRLLYMFLIISCQLHHLNAKTIIINYKFIQIFRKYYKVLQFTRIIVNI